MSDTPPLSKGQPTLTDFLTYALREWGCEGKGEIDTRALVLQLLRHVLFTDTESPPSMMVIVDRTDGPWQSQLADILNIQTKGIVFYLPLYRCDLLYTVKLIKGVPWGMAYPVREVRAQDGSIVFLDPSGCAGFTKKCPYTLGAYTMVIPTNFVSPYYPKNGQREDGATEAYGQDALYDCWPTKGFLR